MCVDEVWWRIQLGKLRSATSVSPCDPLIPDLVEFSDVCCGPTTKQSCTNRPVGRTNARTINTLKITFTFILFYFDLKSAGSDFSHSASCCSFNIKAYLCDVCDYEVAIKSAVGDQSIREKVAFIFLVHRWLLCSSVVGTELSCCICKCTAIKPSPQVRISLSNHGCINFWRKFSLAKLRKIYKRALLIDIRAEWPWTVNSNCKCMFHSERTAADFRSVRLEIPPVFWVITVSKKEAHLWIRFENLSFQFPTKWKCQSNVTRIIVTGKKTATFFLCNLYCECTIVYIIGFDDTVRSFRSIEFEVTQFVGTLCIAYESWQYGCRRCFSCRFPCQLETSPLALCVTRVITVKVFNNSWHVNKISIEMMSFEISLPFFSNFLRPHEKRGKMWI